MKCSYHYVLIEQPFGDLGYFIPDTVAVELQNLDVVFAGSTNVSPERRVRGGAGGPARDSWRTGLLAAAVVSPGWRVRGGARGPACDWREGGLLGRCWCGLSWRRLVVAGGTGVITFIFFDVS